MRYRLNKKLIHMETGDLVQPGESLIEVMTESTYRQKYEHTMHQHLLCKSMGNARYCKADTLQSCVVGTFSIPVKSKLLGEELSFGYYMDRDKMIFVDDTGVVSKMLHELAEIQIWDKTAVPHFFFEFMEFLIREDVIFLQRYEEKLTNMEERLIDSKVREFYKSILECRKEILQLESYYRPLIDLGETLAENHNRLLTEEECRLFRLFSARVTRLYSNAMELREYAIQIQEMYQSQLDIRQNSVMQFLTIITTIFMPLTLIVGWYGMNFINMPELHWRYGYVGVVVVSILITMIQIYYFIKRKWFSS
ncbi:MAG: CorA family divalent cation transporter [Lachnospiraceae bacterium]